MRRLSGGGYAALKEHRAKIGIVFLIVFIDLVGFGIVIPILPLYAEEYGPSPVFFGLLMASFSIMQFVAWPFRTGSVFMLMACVVAVVALLRLRKLPATTA